MRKRACAQVCALVAYVSTSVFHYVFEVRAYAQAPEYSPAMPLAVARAQHRNTTPLTADGRAMNSHGAINRSGVVNGPGITNIFRPGVIA